MATRIPPKKSNGHIKPPAKSSSPSKKSSVTNKATTSSKKTTARSAASTRKKVERRTPVPAVSRSSKRRAPVAASKGWQLRLYVAGDSPRSRVALSNLRRMCEERLKGNYEIEVIDLTKLPHLAKADQILAVPTLVRSIPEPMKRIIGDLSDADRALVALDLKVLPESNS